MSKLTKCDMENLSKLPYNKWFEADEVWPAVKRTSYSLGRLIVAGYVEREIGDGPIYSVKYRKNKDLTDTHC